MPNIIPTVGLERIGAVVLADITHGAVGTGDSEPTTGDTVLEAEHTRKGVSRAIQSGKTIQVRSFFTNAELPTKVEEVGWFMNGSATVDSGELVTRALLEFTKANDDLTIILQMEFSAA